MKKILSKLFSIAGIALLMSLSMSTVFAQADAVDPSDVVNLQATALNGAVRLTWDAATDDVAVTGYQVHYGTTSVNAAGQAYDTMEDAGDALEYIVSGLVNETPYYFSAIAYDAAGNESARWATETSATPSASLGAPTDTVAPQVAEAEALSKQQVSVVFSEEIVLPEEDPQDAFKIEDDATFEVLAITDAEMDEEDETNKTIILTTAEQTVDVVYRLTVGIDIVDTAGNPVVSGTSDTAVFDGSALDVPTDDAVGPTLVSVTSVDNTTALVEFNEAVVLSIDPSANFSIVEEYNALTSLAVLGVELEASVTGVAGAAARLLTAPQGDTSYILVVSGLTDAAGNLINPVTGTMVFSGTASAAVEPPVPDTTPPSDPLELIIQYVLDAEQYDLTLTWDVPAGNLGDSTEQDLYVTQAAGSGQGADYVQSATIDPMAEQYAVSDLDPGDYWFKLTQKDAAGNESTGVIASVSLAETGPGVVGLILVSLGLGKWITKRKQK